MISLSPQAEFIVEEYRERKPQMEALAQRVNTMLKTKLKEQGVELNAIECRVKTEQSLIGKLERKGYKYSRLDDITDLVGIRVVTFYTDDVDKVAAIAKNLFDIDWNNSVDKRKQHEMTSFGYNSLHYICHLKEGSMAFELQMRTALQHVWSAIEHDIGYKGIVKLPGEYRRQFSRLAGMLELADDEFSRLRISMTNYRRQIQALVKSGKLSEVPLSTDSFRSFLEHKPFQRLNQRIAAVNQAEIYPASLLAYLPVLLLLKFETLADVQQLIDEHSDDAYQLALVQLAVTDLDILSETVGLQNLCYVYVLKSGLGALGLKAIFDTLNGEQESNAVLADMLYKQAEELPFMLKLKKN